MQQEDSSIHSYHQLHYENIPIQTKVDNKFMLKVENDEYHSENSSILLNQESFKKEKINVKEELVKSEITMNEFQCNYCQRTFTYKHNLTSHVRIHTGERPYSCNYCEKSFRKTDLLKNHERVHTGEKPYFCILCQKRFNRSCNLKQHVRNHEKNLKKDQVYLKEEMDMKKIVKDPLQCENDENVFENSLITSNLESNFEKSEIKNVIEIPMKTEKSES